MVVFSLHFKQIEDDTHAFIQSSSLKHFRCFGHDSIKKYSIQTIYFRKLYTFAYLREQTIRNIQSKKKINFFMEIRKSKPNASWACL